MDWDVFWSVMFVMLVWVPLIMFWAFTLADLFMRPDLAGWSKVLWLIVIVLLPLIGTVVYYLMKPVSLAYGGAYGTYAYDSGANQGTAASSDRLSTLAELRTSGVINDEQYERGRASIAGTS